MGVSVLSFTPSFINFFLRHTCSSSPVKKKKTQKTNPSICVCVHVCACICVCIYNFLVSQRTLQNQIIRFDAKVLLITSHTDIPNFCFSSVLLIQFTHSSVNIY